MINFTPFAGASGLRGTWTRGFQFIAIFALDEIPPSRPTISSARNMLFGLLALHNNNPYKLRLDPRLDR